METESTQGRGTVNISTKLLASTNDRSEAEVPKPCTRPYTRSVHTTSGARHLLQLVNRAGEAHLQLVKHWAGPELEILGPFQGSLDTLHNLEQRI